MFPRVAFLTQGPAGPLPFPETVMLPVRELSQPWGRGGVQGTRGTPLPPLPTPSAELTHSVRRTRPLRASGRLWLLFLSELRPEVTTCNA